VIQLRLLTDPELLPLPVEDAARLPARGRKIARRTDIPNRRTTAGRRRLPLSDGSSTELICRRPNILKEDRS